LDNPPKVIMITANEGGRHKAYAEMLGVDEYLRKPFAMDVLLEAVERIFSEAQGEGDGNEPADEKPSSRMKRASKKRT
jgi:DNA-binding response OmpR family regulator